MILIITLKSETKTETFRNGRAKGLQVQTTHSPHSHVFTDIYEANIFLETNTESIIGAYELVQDLTDKLDEVIIPMKGTKKSKQIILEEVENNA